MILPKTAGSSRFLLALLTTTLTLTCGAQERIQVPPVVLALNQAFVDVAAQVSTTVVVINVAHCPDFEGDSSPPPLEPGQDRFRGLFEEKGKKKESLENGDPVFDSQGSGVVIRKEGYILTNRHVVDGASKIEVRFADGRRFPAEVKGTDFASDLAVLKIISTEKCFGVARLGDSSTTRVGEFAIAIGAPFELDYSVTFGHISAKGRAQIIPDPVLEQDFIQTDANINPGNSGGPLVNIQGEVIGINTMIRGLRTGIGFAIPINLAREVSDQIILHGRFVRAYLGVVIRGLRDDPEYASLVRGVTEGLLVTEVRREGPAKAKLEPSDIITAVDGKPVGTAQQLRTALRAKPVGQSVVFDVYRKKKMIKVNVTPEPWPEEKRPGTPLLAPLPEEQPNVIGVTAQKMNAAWSESLGLEEARGVIVTEVQKESLSDRAGLRPGDIITEIDHQAVTSLEQFHALLKSADRKKGIMVHFLSRDASKFRILQEK